MQFSTLPVPHFGASQAIKLNATVTLVLSSLGQDSFFPEETNSYRLQVLALLNGTLAAHASLDGILDWPERELPLEIDSDWPTILLRATARARARTPTPTSIICIDQSDHVARFAFFTRGGLILSTSCELRTVSGFKDFLYMTAFILSQREAASEFRCLASEKGDNHRNRLRVRLPATCCTNHRSTMHIRIRTTSDLSLDGATGPRQLTTAVLHALIGYRALFRAGWVHRTISDATVRMHQHFTSLLVDEDQAVRWDDPASPCMNYRSSMYPFLSIRLLSPWTLQRRPKCQSTPLDDLESLLWLLVLSSLKAGADRGLLSASKATHYERLRHRDPAMVFGAKSAFLVRVFEDDEDEEEPPGGFLCPQLRLLREWSSICFLSPHQMNRLMREGGSGTGALDRVKATELCNAALDDTIRIGLVEAAAMSEAWPDPVAIS
ncbi:hypothetical protein B0H11DRAFT_427271 [Mycena galericulata]|nr:hypothetical protein B0H11DRAFT_427271 [Mycena galericulata]